ncbi:hypothetical protein HK100_009334 [Physocladia obscura]|uniref:Uncharacterized protein n=1 Tax=Physocladia obscura TaxID=109957 RepID=A0AAD5T652_9FUNG|nr:hypothetical protein HK100_009334 [Physocladia obscura]
MKRLLLLVVTQLAAAFDWTLLGSGNYYTSFITTMTVPPVPAQPTSGSATYFYWPGLQTATTAPDYLPIGYGVLQPVLTYGASCVEGQPSGASVYRGWHISGEYVNLATTAYAGYRGCLGGNMMDVTPGDSLLMSMTLSGTTWTQTVTRQGVACSGAGNGVSTSSGCQVTYSIDMKGQGQVRAEIVLELYYQAVVTSNVFFTDITLTVVAAEPSISQRFCTSSSRLQSTEVCTGMSLSSDGKTCTIQQCEFIATASAITNEKKKATSSGSGSNVATVTSSSSNSSSSGDGSDISPANIVSMPQDSNSTSSGGDDTASSNSTVSASNGTSSSSLTGSSGSSDSSSSTTATTSNSNTSSSTSHTAMYAGIGTAVAFVVAGGFLVMRRKSGLASASVRPVDEFSTRIAGSASENDAKIDIPALSVLNVKSGLARSQSSANARSQSRNGNNPNRGNDGNEPSQSRNENHVGEGSGTGRSQSRNENHVGSGNGRSQSRNEIVDGRSQSRNENPSSSSGHSQSRNENLSTGNGRSHSRNDSHAVVSSGSSRTTTPENIGGSHNGRSVYEEKTDGISYGHSHSRAGNNDGSTSGNVRMKDIDVADSRSGRKDIGEAGDSNNSRLRSHSRDTADVIAAYAVTSGNGRAHSTDRRHSRDAAVEGFSSGNSRRYSRDVIAESIGSGNARSHSRDPSEVVASGNSRIHAGRDNHSISASGNSRSTNRRSQIRDIDSSVLREIDQTSSSNRRSRVWTDKDEDSVIAGRSHLREADTGNEMSGNFRRPWTSDDHGSRSRDHSPLGRSDGNASGNSRRPNTKGSGRDNSATRVGRRPRTGANATTLSAAFDSGDEVDISRGRQDLSKSGHTG